MRRLDDAAARKDWGSLVVVLLAQPTYAQQAPTTSSDLAVGPSLSMISREAAGPPTLRAVRLAEPLRIDGRLDEALYTTIAPISDFVQMEPDEGAPATERTELWIAFDGDTVRIEKPGDQAIRHLQCHEPGGGRRPNLG
jgi:hypothetical protein